MAVTPGGKVEVSALVLHGKAGAAQTQCLTQGCAGNGLSADGERFCVTGGGLFDRAEPAFRCGKIGRDAKAGKSLLHLRPPRPLPENFPAVHRAWRSKKLTLKQAAKACEMPVGTFYSKAVQWETTAALPPGLDL